MLRFFTPHLWFCLLMACNGHFSSNDGSAVPGTDSGPATVCTGCTNSDCDFDELTNEAERILGTDPCKSDTDGDGIGDGIEANAPKICVGAPELTTPRPLTFCTVDGDCASGACVGFDPLNSDQDSDGVVDGEEDRDHNGRIGTCSADCSAGQSCGTGQNCTDSHCYPAWTADCGETETDPRLKDTDGDGKLDVKEGSNIVCNTNALVAPSVSIDSQGDWTLALDPQFAAAVAVPIKSATSNQAAAIFDDAKSGVAGFVISKSGGSTALTQDEADEVEMAKVANLSITAVFNRRPFSTYDGFSAATSQRLIQSNSPSNSPALRASLLSALLGVPSTDLTIPVGANFGTASQFTLLITTIARQDRTLLIGAIAPSASFDDLKAATAIRMRDLSNATAIAQTGRGLDAECDDHNLAVLPVADIVWLIDTSGSMFDDQQLIADTATEFFSTLQSSGIDFRVGVMQAGCGTEDVALTENAFTLDQTKFSQWITAPTGPSSCEKEAPITAGMNLHQLVLSKNAKVTSSGDMSMGLRENAKLVYVFVTDEEERNLQFLDTESRDISQSDMEAKPDFAPLVSYYQQAQISAFGMIALMPDCRIKFEPSWAAKSMIEQTGGASWPICKTDKSVLNAALKAMVSAIQGASSKFTLSRVPISSTLKLASSATVIPRSSDAGFDYDGPNNAIIFNGGAASSYAPQLGDAFVVSYRFFDDAPIIK